MKLLFFGLLFSCVSASLVAQKNVILIIADDLGSDYCGFYENHVDTVNLPNVRRLLKGGVRFKNAWANPFCSPTRAGILTGRYSFRTGVGAAIGGAGSAVLDTAEMTIPRLLKKFKPTGLSQAHIGKWHLQTPTPKTNFTFPNKMGYDHFEGSFPGELPNYFSWTKITNGSEATSTRYATTENVDNAISFIKKNKEQSFFLWLAFNAPHIPLHLPPADLTNTTKLSGSAADISANPKAYFKAMNEAMDHEIGRLFDSLTTYNLWAKTDIIFIGDNGDDSPVAQSIPAKGSVYQGGLNVPMIISGPSVTNPNRVSDALVHTTDLFATILELFGHSTWASQISASKPVDSKSLFPILRNEKTDVRDWLFAEVFGGPAPASDGKTIRNKSYKFIAMNNGNKLLFNLQTDPSEKTNLYSTAAGANLTNLEFLCSEMSKLLQLPNGCSLVLASQEEIKSMNPFPNPFGAQIQLAPHLADKEYELLNAAGQRVLHGNNVANQDLSQLPKGVYFLRVDGQIFKLVKE